MLLALGLLHTLVSMSGICRSIIKHTPIISCEYQAIKRADVSIGEHTSINHAWIFSALESAVRGVVQLLLDDGLVDEAQEVCPVFLSAG